MLWEEQNRPQARRLFVLIQKIHHEFHMIVRNKIGGATICDAMQEVAELEGTSMANGGSATKASPRASTDDEIP